MRTWFLIPIFILIMFLVGCGEIVEQNYIVLEFKTMGDRDVDLAAGSESQYETTILTATRLPLIKVGRKYLSFPIGNQSYRFTGKPSIESPENESFKISALDGNIYFDFVVHLHVDKDLSPEELKTKLVAFSQKYSLLKYAGSNNPLGLFVKDRLRDILINTCKEYTSSKEVLFICRDKKTLNQFVLGKMNELFEPYALRFTLIGVSSALGFDEDMQKRMDEVIQNEINARKLEIENEKIAPVRKQITAMRNATVNDSAKLTAAAEKDAANIKMIANTQRRKRLIALLGVDGFTRYEQINQLGELVDSDVKINIIPNKAAVYIPPFNSTKSN